MKLFTIPTSHLGLLPLYFLSILSAVVNSEIVTIPVDPTFADYMQRNWDTLSTIADQMRVLGQAQTLCPIGSGFGFELYPEPPDSEELLETEPIPRYPPINPDEPRGSLTFLVTTAHTILREFDFVIKMTEQGVPSETRKVLAAVGFQNLREAKTVHKYYEQLVLAIDDTLKQFLLFAQWFERGLGLPKRFTIEQANPLMVVSMAMSLRRTKNGMKEEATFDTRRLEGWNDNWVYMNEITSPAPLEIGENGMEFAQENMKSPYWKIILEGEDPIAEEELPIGHEYTVPVLFERLWEWYGCWAGPISIIAEETVKLVPPSREPDAMIVEQEQDVDPMQFLDFMELDDFS
ncbi:hypothetical protein H072_6274 [Dactylellina haptotyla CBS 200.50]|uniref:Uncharacterized protein n=1 Tax=Dactylellina haptotyla (strain CBS 200.50) TaxID=1284197 RepID=S8AAI0_DACHA|nr:hypothetical protein H072_6274 [Dactylellina haptotyla CBS 200.50]